MPWCDMCTFPVTFIPICESRRIWNGLWRHQFRKKPLFFPLWWDEIYFSWTLNVLNFLFYSFHLWKTLYLLFPYASFSKIFPANASFCNRDFIFTDEWHQNCSIWSFMAFSDLVGFLIIYCIWDLALWLKCPLESMWPLLGRAGARKIKFGKKKKDGKKQKAGDDQLLVKSWKCLWVVVGNIHTLPSPFLMHCHLLQLKASSNFYCSKHCDV